MWKFSGKIELAYKDLFINFYIFSLLLVYLLKHNIANLLVCMSPIIFYIFKKKILYFNKNFYFLYFFFLYLLFQSFLYLNLNGLYYLRFLFLFFLIVNFINFTNIKKIIFFLKFLIIFFCADVIFQNFTGHNIFFIINSKNVPTSFFGKEIVGGTYLLHITIIFLIFTAFTNDKKSLKQLMFFSPILIYTSILSIQRIAFLNYLILIILTFFTCFAYNFLNKFKFSFNIIKILFVCTISIFLIFNFTNISKNLIIFQKLQTTLDDIFGKKENLVVTYINYDFDKIVFDKKNFLKSDLPTNQNNAFDQIWTIGYEDVFARGYSNGKWTEIRISDINNSARFFNKRFSFNIADDEINIKLQKYYNVNQINSDYYLEFLNKFNNYEKGQTVVAFQTLEKLERSIIDTGWYSHFYTGLSIWKDNRFFGAGIKNFRELCASKKYWDMSSLANVFCTTHPHNFFIELLAEVGVFGLILFYLIIINVVWRILKSNLKSNIKILLIGIILIMFQPLQTSGRFFSSNVALFNFYIISLYYFFLINLKKNNNS